MNNNNINKAVEIVINSDAILITAGAGMGVDSGLPDFRGNTGFWKAYPPIAKLGISFSEMANPSWFLRKPEFAWAFYGHRLNLYRNTKPHEGFKQLLEIAKDKSNNYFIFTSNVDGHFQKASFEDNKIVECHGSINYLQCIHPCTNEVWDASSLKVEVDMDSFTVKNIPKCKNCNDIARPNILMFGDWNWINDRTDEQYRLLNNWLIANKEKNNKIVIIECGAGTAVPTVRYTSERIINDYNAYLIRINPRDYQVPQGHISLACGAVEGIKQIYEKYILK